MNVHTNIEKAIKTNEPFVYLKKNNLTFETIPLNNLFGAVEDIGGSSLYRSGIPNELITQIDMSKEVPQITYTNDESVVYYSPFKSDTKEHVLQIIKLFNQLSSIKLIIYTSSNIYKYVNEFSNSNISFCCYTDPNELTIKANKIITHGYSARSFIKQKTSTIIIGPYGLGGWVTPSNINYLLKDNFKGRPSGDFNEFISLEILVDEFLEIKEEENLNNILNENASIISSYLDQFSLNSIENFVSEQNKLFNEFTSTNKRGLLKPKLASNTEVIKESQTTLIRRKEINDVLFSLPESDLGFLEDLRNNFTCQELKEKYEMTDDEFWEIIIPLWERKAIVFSL